MVAKITIACAAVAAVAACGVLEAPGPSKHQNTLQTDPQWRRDCFPDMRKNTTFAIDDRKNHIEKAQKQRKQDFKTDPLSKDKPTQTDCDRRICCKQNVCPPGTEPTHCGK
jgi:hypothetical protein